MTKAKHFLDAKITNSDIVQVDTNFLLLFMGYGADEERRKQCESLMCNVTSNGGMVVIATKTVEELTHVVVRGLFNEKGINYDKKSREKEFDQFTNLTLTGVQKAQRYLTDFYNHPGVFNQPIGSVDLQTLNKSQEYMMKYGMQTSDAIILATAITEQVNYLATCDKDYAKVDEPGLTVLIDEKTYKNCSI